MNSKHVFLFPTVTERNKYNVVCNEKNDDYVEPIYAFTCFIHQVEYGTILSTLLALLV
jgi:hypothetical protein